MKNVLKGIVAHIISALKSLALAYIIVQILSNRFPEVKIFLDSIVASGNNWFAGIGPGSPVFCRWCTSGYPWWDMRSSCALFGGFFASPWRFSTTEQRLPLPAAALLPILNLLSDLPRRPLWPRGIFLSKIIRQSGRAI